MATETFHKPQGTMLHTQLYSTMQRWQDFGQDMGVRGERKGGSRHAQGGEQLVLREAEGETAQWESSGTLF